MADYLRSEVEALKGGVEWGVALHSAPGELHRGPMGEEDARKWVREWEEDGGCPGVFVVVMRRVSAWESAP